MRTARCPFGSVGARSYQSAMPGGEFVTLRLPSGGCAIPALPGSVRSRRWACLAQPLVQQRVATCRPRMFGASFRLARRLHKQIGGTASGCECWQPGNSLGYRNLRDGGPENAARGTLRCVGRQLGPRRTDSGSPKGVRMRSQRSLYCLTPSPMNRPLKLPGGPQRFPLPIAIRTVADAARQRHAH